MRKQLSRLEAKLDAICGDGSGKRKPLQQYSTLDEAGVWNRLAAKCMQCIVVAVDIYYLLSGADPGFCEGGFEWGFVDSLKGTFEQK